MSSSHQSVPFFKSPFRVINRWLCLSREGLREKHQRLQEQLEQSEAHRQRLVNEKRELEQRLEQQRRESQQKIAELSSSQVRMLPDPILYRHRYGARMISVCCNLARAVGFRSAEAVLKIVRTWLGSDFEIPSWTTIRSWLCRSGVATLTEACTREDDWILFIDHSVQLGETNVLVVLGIRESQMPQGRALVHEDLKTLAVVPGVSKSKEAVAAALKELTDVIGIPICVVADGAKELLDGAKTLKNNGQSIIVQDDMKHKAANILKKTLGKQPRFLEFQALTGTTTPRIQQTELVHFLAPKKKIKSRFMNLAPQLRWGQMILYHLKTPTAAGNLGISMERLQEKLGWVLEYEDDLKSWQLCQRIVSETLAFTNQRGVYRGATDELIKHLCELGLSLDSLSQQVRDELVGTYRKCEDRLIQSPHADKTLPVSTEVLESMFGRYKQLQRQHNRGSFTSLLAAFAALMKPSTPEDITRQFKSISNQDLKNWVKQARLSNSTQAKKNAAYKEAKRHLIDTKTLLL